MAEYEAEPEVRSGATNKGFNEVVGHFRRNLKGHG